MEESGRFRWCGFWASAVLGLLLAIPSFSAQAARPSGEIGKNWGNPKGQECVDCHLTESPGLYWEWNRSKHGQNGVNCLDCHERRRRRQGCLRCTRTH